MKIKYVNYIVCAILLLLLIGLALYFTKFHGAMSDESTDWASFSTYLSFYLSLGSLIVIFYFAYLTYDINDRSVNLTNESIQLAQKVTLATENLNKHQTTPVLDVLTKKSTYVAPNNDMGYFLINCSNVAAADIHFKFSINDGLGIIESIWINLNVLTQMLEIELKWMRFQTQFEICYTDILRERYYRCIFFQFETVRSEITKEDFNKFITNANNIRHKEILEHFNSKNENWQNISPLLFNYINDFFEAIRKID